CANSFETDRSSSLDFESRWRWPVSYRSIEVLAVIIDILIILSAGVLADTIYRLATTGFASEITDYSAAAAVVAALFASLLERRGHPKAGGACGGDRQSPSRYAHLDRRLYVPGWLRFRPEDREHVFSRHNHVFRRDRSLWFGSSPDVLA